TLFRSTGCPSATPFPTITWISTPCGYGYASGRTRSWKAPDRSGITGPNSTRWGWRPRCANSSTSYCRNPHEPYRVLPQIPEGNGRPALPALPGPPGSGHLRACLASGLDGLAETPDHADQRKAPEPAGTRHPDLPAGG